MRGGERRRRASRPVIAAAARHVGLQAVDARRADSRKSAEHVRRTRRLRSRGRRALLAQQPQAVEVVGGDGLLEPASRPTRRVALGPARAPALRVERAVRVDEELRVVPIASRAASSRCGSRAGSRPTFIFTRGMPSADPAAELLAQPLERVRAEAAAAVDRHGRRAPRRAASTSGTPSRRALQIPERGVDRGERHERRCRGGPMFRSAAAHRRPCRAYVERVAPSTTPASVASISAPRPLRRVGPAEPASRRRACASTTTIVVESHSSVPSDSGSSVGIV